MSALRYSGTLILRISYVAADDSYTVRIREANDDARFATMTGLRLAPMDAARLPVDSSEAYDLAAEAALGFASHDDEAIYAYACEMSASDGTFHVARSPKHAWSAEHV